MSVQNLNEGVLIYRGISNSITLSSNPCFPVYYSSGTLQITELQSQVTGIKTSDNGNEAQIEVDCVANCLCFIVTCYI